MCVSSLSSHPASLPGVGMSSVCLIHCLAGGRHSLVIPAFDIADQKGDCRVHLLALHLHVTYDKVISFHLSDRNDVLKTSVGYIFMSQSPNSSVHQSIPFSFYFATGLQPPLLLSYLYMHKALLQHLLYLPIHPSIHPSIRLSLSLSLFSTYPISLNLSILL